MSETFSDLARIDGLPPVSRETQERLEAYVGLLRRWQATHNLVAPSTLPRIWTRHVADSLQIQAVLAEWFPHGAPLPLIDLGSGGGLPGIVLACILAEGAAGTGLAGVRSITLVESNGKKAGFLRHVQRTLDLPVTIEARRIEDVAAERGKEAHIVTARALAALDPLLGLAAPLLMQHGSLGIFPKGRAFEVEVDRARLYWSFSLERRGSLTDAEAAILVVSDVRRKSDAA